MCDTLPVVAYAVQEGLFDQTERQWLDHSAWIDVRPGWLNDAGTLFDELVAATPWRAERRPMYDRVVDVPRLLSFHDLRTGHGPHPRLAELLGRLNDGYAAELGEPFTTAGMCLYRDGNDSVAWHADDLGRGRKEDTMVAIVSLGSVRTFAMRPLGGGKSMRLPLAHGDLLVMGGSCQRTWEHAVPKTSKTCGPRLSIQFRPHDVR